MEPSSAAKSLQWGPARSLSAGATPRTNSVAGSDDSEELVEITLDIQGDNTYVVHSVGPVVSASSPLSKSVSSKSMRRTSSQRLIQRSQELTQEAMARARLFSQEVRSELKRLTRTGSRTGGGGGDRAGRSAGSVEVGPSAAAASGLERALAERRERQRHAEQDRKHNGARRALKGLRFISSSRANASWSAVSERFDKLAAGGYLARADFAECIGMTDSAEFALLLLDTLCRRRRTSSERVNKDELREIWTQITDNSFDSRLQIFFDMVDKNADGCVKEDEVKEIIRLSASSNKLARLKEQAGEYAALIMEELDKEGLGYIELWQLETLLLQKDTYLNYSQALGYTSQMLSQNLAALQNASRIRTISTKLRYWLEDNWKRLWVLSVWICIMAGLFAWKFIQYKNRYAFQVMGYCLAVAKGAAETLKLNMALILLPVCRNTVTWLRSTKAAQVLPFDDNINFHMTIAIAIVIGVILHVGDHLACDFPRLISASPEKYQPLQEYFGEKKPTYLDLLRGPEGITGVLMLLSMVIAFTLATRWFRRSKIKLPKPFDKLTGYNAFWYSHHLLILVYILLIIHGECLYLIHVWYKKTTWMYLAVPVSLYMGERILRFSRSSYSVKIEKVAIFVGNCLTLRMARPPTFRYKSGQYIFVKCPDVSPFEWHPFSITSAPGDDYISIHVRICGDWTRELKRVFAAACEESQPGKSGLLRADAATKKILPKLKVDGPYGAPAQDYKKYDVIVLIGLGIGATPFISILKDLLNNVKSEDEEDTSEDLYQPMGPSGGIVDLATLMRITEEPKRMMKTRNAYFFWVTKEEGSFDWFKGIMNEVEELDKRGIVEMHNYLTSVYEEGDARSALVTMLQSLAHAKGGMDVVSGTRVRTHFARPNWEKVLKKISSKHPRARIGVFFCGNQEVALDLSKLCQDFTNQGRAKLEFHKERF